MITNIEEGNIELLNITSPFHLESISPTEVLAEQRSPLFNTDMNSEWDLVWKDVTKIVNIKSYKSSSKISKKTILSNSCGYCKSGELLALVGTSGSGMIIIILIYL